MTTGSGDFVSLAASARASRSRTTSEIMRPEADVIMDAFLAAHRQVLRARVLRAAGDLIPLEGPEQVEEIDPERAGSPFKIPLVIPEGIESGDGRSFSQGALSRRELPLPLMWQMQTGDAHDGSYLVGRVDQLERTGDGIGDAYGVMDTGPYGKEAERLIRAGMLRWVSADLDKFEAEVLKPDELGIEGVPDEDHIVPEKMNITKGRVMAVTLVAKPAFQECTIELINEDEVPDVADGVYQEPGPIAASAASLCAAVPIHPPKVWFTDPNMAGLTPISVDDSGRVFGHIASWDMDHIGMPFGTRAPSSRSRYAYFHTGVIRTDEGDDVACGQLTLAGGHAPLNADALQAIKHYDDTKSAIADVKAGEDSFGIWVAGALRPDVTPEQVRAFRASSPSGDWRQIRGSLELVAVCQVNVPGFPVTRAQVASGAVLTLVAAGAGPVARLHTPADTSFEVRLRRLELAERHRDEARVAAARARVEPLLAARREQTAVRAAAIRSRVDPLLAARRERERQALAARVAETRARVTAAGVPDYLTEFKDFSPDKREQLAKKKHAMKDGSFPIENVADLKRAIKAYGRTTDDKKAAVRRHITRRARGLSKPDLIPDSWSENSLDGLALSILDIKENDATETAAVQTIIAAGDEARLKEYWAHGEGAAKIRWGTDGDHTRCVRQLSKYVGPETIHGLCTNIEQLARGGRVG